MRFKRLDMSSIKASRSYSTLSPSVEEKAEKEGSILFPGAPEIDVDGGYGCPVATISVGEGAFAGSTGAEGGEGAFSPENQEKQEQ